jgi:hypothetical protein
MYLLYQVLVVISSSTHIFAIQYLIRINPLRHHQMRLLGLIQTARNLSGRRPAHYSLPFLVASVVADGCALSYLVVQMHELLSVLPSVVSCQDVLYFLSLGHVLLPLVVYVVV